MLFFKLLLCGDLRKGSEGKITNRAMKSRWSSLAASLLICTFLAAQTQFLRYCHRRIEVVELVKGSEITPHVLVVSFPLIMHLRLHRGSRLNVLCRL